MREAYLPAETLPDEDWFRDDAALRRFLTAHLSPDVWAALAPRLATLGTVAPQKIDPLARRADIHTPTLDAEGNLVLDESYRGLQRLAREHRVFTYHASGAPRMAPFALGYLYAQAESGYYCPACMTDGAAFVLERNAPDLARELVPRLLSEHIEDAIEGAMYLTEKTGGSDVGSTRTTATQAPDGSWRLTGDKWFCSNAGAQVTLTLARMPDAPEGTRGLGLFLLPELLPDGSRNPGLRRVRLKEKLGVRSMATAEVELRDAHATLIADAGSGFKAMAEMVNLSRLYNAVASIAVARRALREGIKNGAWRAAFGKPLHEQPLYARAVCALAVDVRGALYFTLDTATTFDRAAGGDEHAYRLLRALTPLAKAETARLSVRAASEACEMLGGNGYVKPWVTERLLRDAQVLPIWEGTSNVQALDFLRACVRDGAADALVEDSLGMLRDTPAVFAKSLVEAWEAWSAELVEPREEALREMAAGRLMTRAFHLRAATLLALDARDGDEAAVAHAHAYVARNVWGDEVGFELLVRKEGRNLGR